MMKPINCFLVVFTFSVIFIHQPAFGGDDALTSAREDSTRSKDVYVEATVLIEAGSALYEPEQLVSSRIDAKQKALQKLAIKLGSGELPSLMEAGSIAEHLQEKILEDLEGLRKQAIQYSFHNVRVIEDKVQDGKYLIRLSVSKADAAKAVLEMKSLSPAMLFKEYKTELLSLKVNDPKRQLFADQYLFEGNFQEARQFAYEYLKFLDSPGDRKFSGLQAALHQNQIDKQQNEYPTIRSCENAIREYPLNHKAWLRLTQLHEEKKHYVVAFYVSLSSLGAALDKREAVVSYKAIIHSYKRLDFAKDKLPVSQEVVARFFDMGVSCKTSKQHIEYNRTVSYLASTLGYTYRRMYASSDNYAFTEIVKADAKRTISTDAISKKELRGYALKWSDRLEKNPTTPMFSFLMGLCLEEEGNEFGAASLYLHCLGMPASKVDNSQKWALERFRTLTTKMKCGAIERVLFLSQNINKMVP